LDCLVEQGSQMLDTTLCNEKQSCAPGGFKIVALILVT